SSVGAPLRRMTTASEVMIGSPITSPPDARRRGGVGGHRTETGETYTALVTDLVVEVLAGTGRHGTLTVVRAR
ncbi:hypothetical protein ABT285_36665, partial [Streptomyces microflavus]